MLALSEANLKKCRLRLLPYAARPAGVSAAILLIDNTPNKERTPTREESESMPLPHTAFTFQST
jgi:hypothetical protein